MPRRSTMANEGLYPLAFRRSRAEGRQPRKERDCGRSRMSENVTPRAMDQKTAFLRGRILPWRMGYCLGKELPTAGDSSRGNPPDYREQPLQSKQTAGPTVKTPRGEPCGSIYSSHTFG